jgi:hypothetical protein
MLDESVSFEGGTTRTEDMTLEGKIIGTLIRELAEPHLSIPKPFAGLFVFFTPHHP